MWIAKTGAVNSRACLGIFTTLIKHRLVVVVSKAHLSFLNGSLLDLAEPQGTNTSYHITTLMPCAWSATGRRRPWSGCWTWKHLKRLDKIDHCRWGNPEQAPENFFAHAQGSDVSLLPVSTAYSQNRTTLG